MERLLGGGGGKRKLSKALSCVTPVFFCLLLMPMTTTTARLLANVPPSISPSAVQECSSTDEVAALKEIASALNRNVEKLSSNWTWGKAVVASFLVLLVIELVKIKTGIYIGVRTQYLLDRKKEAVAQEDPLAASVNPSADPPAQQADREEKQTNSRGDGVFEALENVKVDPNRRDSPPIWPLVDSECSTVKEEAVIDERNDHCCICIEGGSGAPAQSMRSRMQRQVDMPA